MKSKEVFRNHIKKMVATKHSRLQNIETTLSLESKSWAASQKETLENEPPSLIITRSPKKLRGPHLVSQSHDPSKQVIRIPRDRNHYTRTIPTGNILTAE